MSYNVRKEPVRFDSAMTYNYDSYSHFTILSI